MMWLRARTRKLSLLALFALAMQIGLSFGHFHHDRAFAGKSTVAAGLATSPDSGKDTDGRGDQCAICATIALANALIDSLPPTLPLPVVTIATDTLRAAAASNTSTHALGFQSRAPPTA